MTPVLFHFLTPTGLPLALTPIEIQLSKSAFDEEDSGVVMPRLVTAITDADGKATVNLWPHGSLYYVTVMDPTSDAGLSYKFYVPEVAPGLEVRLQDIVVVGEMSPTPYDEAALLAIQNAKALTLTYKVAAAASAATASTGAVTATTGATTATTKAAEAVISAADAAASAALAASTVTGVITVNTRSGAVVLSSADVGLGNANNTSDANKPVSTAQATADTAVQTAAATDATTKANAAQAAAIVASTPVSHLGSGGAAHANVVAAGAAGFMSGADKTKLDAITGANSGDETGARIATLHHAASAKSALGDADEITGGDSATSFGLIRTTWTDVKTFLATWIGGGTIAGSFTTLAASGNVTLGGASTDTLNVGNGGIVKDASGNVGIGGASTGSKFQVLGAIEATWAPNIFNTRLRGTSSATSGSAGAGISFVGYTTGSTTFTDLAFISGIKENTTDGNYAGALVLGTRQNGSGGGNMEVMRISSTGNALVTYPGGLGYGTGAGGTVTQATSRTTGVTLSKPTGKITLFSTTATTGTFASFTLTNTLIAATDVVIVNFASATSADKYSLFVTAVAAGSCRIQVYNIAAVAVAEAPVINFAVIKGATS